MLELDDRPPSIQYVVDEDGRRAVQLDLTAWDQIVVWLEDLGHEATMREALAAGDNLIHSEVASKPLRYQNPT